MTGVRVERPPTPAPTVAPRVVHFVWTALLVGIGTGSVLYALVGPRNFASPVAPIFGRVDPARTLSMQTNVTLLVVAAMVTVIVLALPVVAIPRYGRDALLGLVALGLARLLSGYLNGAGMAMGLLALPLTATAILVFPRPSRAWLEPRILWVLRAHVWGSVAAALLFSAWAVVPNYGIPVPHSRLAGITTHPNALGMLAAVLLILEWKRRPLSRVGVVLAAVVLVWAQSKTAWGAVAVVAAVGLARWLGRRAPARSLLPHVVLAGVVAFTSYIGLGLAEPEQATTKGDDTTETFTGRTAIWEATLEVWQSDPLIGYGPYLWDDPMDRRFAGRVGFPPGHAHNQLIQALGEAGVIGGLALVVALVGLARAARRGDHVTGGATGAIFLVLAITCVTGVPIGIVPFSAMFLLTFLLSTYLVVAANEVTDAR